MQDSINQYIAAVKEHHDIHDKYITDAWGMIERGKTYRNFSDEDWQTGLVALEQLKKQENILNALDMSLFVAQGMQIRLTQRFFELRHNIAIQQDDDTRLSRLLCSY